MFTKSPFNLVASPDSASCWAGRPQLYERIKRLHRGFTRSTDSTLDLMWANLGAGKSHVLYHLAFLLSNAQAALQAVPVVAEMPEDTGHFLDLYKRIVKAMPIGKVAIALAASDGSSSMRQAGNVLCHGGPAEKELVTDWLAGGHPHLSDLRRVAGIGARIEDDVAATDALVTIALALAQQQQRLVILLDEFQRIGVLKQRARDSILSNLRSVFSHCPERFSVMVAVGSRAEESAMQLLPAELKTLLGPRPTLSLGEMTPDEAYEFALQRMDFYRPAGWTGPRTSPFTEDAIQTIIKYLHETAQVSLIPRHILQALGEVYNAADEEQGDISSNNAIKGLKELNWERKSNGSN